MPSPEQSVRFSIAVHTLRVGEQAVIDRGLLSIFALDKKVSPQVKGHDYI